MVKMTTRDKENDTRLNGRRLRVQGLGFALGLTSLAFLTACEGTLGAQGPDGDQQQGDGDGGISGDGDGPIFGDGDGMVPVGTIDGNGFKIFPRPEFNLDGAPIYSRAVAVTNDQWAASVQVALNLPSPPTQSNSFLKPVEGFTLFTNNEITLAVNNEMREAYQLAAAEIAVDQLADPGAIARIAAGSDADSFIRTFGRRAFRRPLTEDEVSGYMTVYNVGAGLTGDQDEFTKGANLVIEAMLQSPHFLYRTETSPDGAALTGFERISKLSFWLLGAPPTEALLDRAAAGEFDTPEGVAAAADEMLADPRAAESMVDMFGELFRFSKYREVVKEDPGWSPELNAELEEASRLFFEYIFSNDLGLDEILNSTQGFVGPLMAQFYGISPAPAQLTLTELGPERPGYFSQVPYQMAMGDGLQSDGIHRGVFLNFEVMCAKLLVPAGEIPQPPAPKPDQTNRERIDGHTGIGTCGEGCHGGYINPLGFAFENFDGMGRVRTMDAGKPVDTYTAYPFGPNDETIMVAFNGAPELMPLISQSEEAHACLARNVMSHGLARDVISSDWGLIETLMQVSMSDGGSLKQIIRELVKTPAFLSRPGAI